jgi:hypothetical protein
VTLPPPAPLAALVLDPAEPDPAAVVPEVELDVLEVLRESLTLPSLEQASIGHATRSAAAMRAAPWVQSSVMWASDGIDPSTRELPCGSSARCPRSAVYSALGAYFPTFLANRSIVDAAREKIPSLLTMPGHGRIYPRSNP